MRKSITLKETVDKLNEILRLDRPGISRFCLTRTPINDEIVHHPTVQVHGYSQYPEDPNPSLGPIGLLNGLFGDPGDEGGAIGVIISKKESHPRDWLIDFFIEREYSKTEKEKK
jgi:hypothetical protein